MEVSTGIVSISRFKSVCRAHIFSFSTSETHTGREAGEYSVVLTEMLRAPVLLPAHAHMMQIWARAG